MNVRKSPIPAAKLCFIDGETASASHVRIPGERDDQEDRAADEDRAEALLPGDVEGGQAEGDERVLPHVRRDRDRAIRIKTHQQRAEGRGEDRRHRAGTGRDSGERENRRIHDDDVGHRDEGGDPSDDFRADTASALLDAKHAIRINQHCLTATYRV
jgi:hypothetical protein